MDYGKKTLVMGILNITPDSFSDGGRYRSVEAAVAKAKQMELEGADLIDIGGESTRPGSAAVSVEEELNRILPVIEAVSKEVSIPISVDTYKAETAKQAIHAGAHIINDVWGGKADDRMAAVAAELDVPFILMHNRQGSQYGAFIRDAFHDVFESIDIAKRAGVREENIILDPGIGFAKDFNKNMEMMRNLDHLAALGYPVLLATSRKSMIGEVLGLPPQERVEGTLATVCYGIQKGCHMVRVHDVKETVRTCKMMDALVGKGTE